jgi:hypothetical protein
MAEDRSVENNKRARQYLRSNVYRICSWSSLILVVASFLVPSHRIWFIYVAAAVWFSATLPVLRVVPYSHRLDIHNRRDKRFLLFVSVYILLTLVGAGLFVYLETRR